MLVEYIFFIRADQPIKGLKMIIVTDSSGSLPLVTLDLLDSPQVGTRGPEISESNDQARLVGKALTVRVTCWKMYPVLFSYTGVPFIVIVQFLL